MSKEMVSEWNPRAPEPNCRKEKVLDDRHRSRSPLQKKQKGASDRTHQGCTESRKVSTDRGSETRKERKTETEGHRSRNPAKETRKGAAGRSRSQSPMESANKERKAQVEMETEKSRHHSKTPLNEKKKEDPT